MTEHPIIFSAPMIRAILAGRKTMTRRIVKPRKDRDIGCHLAPCELAGEINSGKYRNSACGQPGDTLWVRETWAVPHKFDGIPPSFIAPSDRVHYGATEDLGGLLRRPSIFMPRWASRITLRVTDVRVERLQDISEDDALAEGIARQRDDGFGLPDGSYYDAADPRVSFQRLWDSLNVKRGAGWDVNPWVFVIEFQRA